MKIYLALLGILLVVSCASQKKRVVIAHRGASGYLPEHTFAGVVMAHSWGVDYIEPDLVLTKDNHLVVLHDIYIDMTTNVRDLFPLRKREDGRFYAIDFTLAEIKQLKVYERKNLKTRLPVFENRYPGEKSIFRVPTFAEFIELVQSLNKVTKKNVGIYPEIKHPEFHQKEGKDIVLRVFKELENYGYNKVDSNSVIQCFYPPSLKRLKYTLKAKMPLVALIGENSWRESSTDYEHYKSELGLQELSEYVDGIGVHFSHLIDKRESKGSKIMRSNIVQLAHKYNLNVHVYTHRSDHLPHFFTSDQAFFRFIFYEADVDGIFSDFADIAMKYTKD